MGEQFDYDAIIQYDIFQMVDHFHEENDRRQSGCLPCLAKCHSHGGPDHVARRRGQKMFTPVMFQTIGMWVCIPV